MSLRATQWAWAQAVGAARKLVLLALAEHADESGLAWPSVERLAELTGLDRKTVMRALTSLETESYVVIDRLRGATTRYRLYCNGRCKSHKAVPK